MKNIKYTLYAEIGSCFRSGKHTLYIGDWLLPDMGKYVVLAHGTMSRNEYNGICTKYRISIYEYAPISWVDIKPYQENGFFRFQRIGSLYKVRDQDIWKGDIRHGKWY